MFYVDGDRNNKIIFRGQNLFFTIFLSKFYDIFSQSEHWALPTCTLLGLVLCFEESLTSNSFIIKTYF